MRISTGFVEQSHRENGAPAKITCRLAHHGGDVCRQHAFVDVGMHVSVRGHRDIVGYLHERDLCRRLEHAATARDGFTGNNLEVGGCLLHAIDNEVTNGFFDSDLALLQAAVFQDTGDKRERIIVFVPGANVIAERHALANRGFLEIRRDDRELAFGRNDDTGEAFGSPPADTGEIHEGRPGLDDERVDAGGLHELLCFRDARFTLGDRNRHGVAGHILQCTGRVGR
jgi:hypothetical protein